MHSRPANIDEARNEVLSDGVDRRNRNAALFSDVDYSARAKPGITKSLIALS